jgi:Fe-S cluster biogenesis protein NfuA
MSCHHVPGGLQDLLDETWGAADSKVKTLPQLLVLGAAPAMSAAPPKDDGHAISPYQFDKKVEKAIDQYVRPMLKNDGGDVEIVDIKDMLVYCRLSGACQGCAGAGQTLRMLIEQTLKEMVDERIRVIGV